ncbi:MAG: hypothetical protein ACOY94_21880 [Bacillota bacterium]
MLRKSVQWIRSEVRLVFLGVLIGVAILVTYLQFGAPFGYANTAFQIPARPIPEPWEMPTHMYGLPNMPEAVSVVPLAGRKVLLLPVLLSDPEVPYTASILDPLKWEEKGTGPTVGRRSIWYMDPGSTMLYGVVIDTADMDADNIGVAYVVVKRIDETSYDIILEDTKGTTLFAARGSLIKINEQYGAGALVPIGDQAAVREQYGATWDVGPNEFFMFRVPIPVGTK